MDDGGPGITSTISGVKPLDTSINTVVNPFSTDSLVKEMEKAIAAGAAPHTDGHGKEKDDVGKCQANQKEGTHEPNRRQVLDPVPEQERDSKKSNSTTTTAQIQRFPDPERFKDLGFERCRGQACMRFACNCANRAYEADASMV